MRVLLIDDHPFVRDGIKAVMEGQSEFVITAEAGSREEAIAALERDTFDIAVVDLTLQVDDDLELISWLRNQRPGLRLLVLSMQDEALRAEQLLRLGVAGYLMKDATADQLVVALKRIATGQRYVSDRMMSRLVAHSPKRTAYAPESGRNDPLAALTGRELEVLDRIGRGQSTSQIAEALGLSMKTVDAHRRGARDKLNLASTSELIRFATHWVAAKRG